MESMMSNVAPATFYCYNPDPAARQHGQFLPHHQQMPVFAVVPTLPSTPVYSRPSSSCSQTAQPQPYRSLTSVPTNLMTPMPSPPAPASAIVHSHMMNKPTIMLETELHDADGSRYPSTPPLSTVSSTGSPGGCDMLATPLNPMFSGFDSFHGIKDVCASDVAPENLALAGWSSCSSPPLTPVFIHPQTQNLVSGSSVCSSVSVQSNELLSVSACPSLSPSPSPYPRSIASEQDNDFCDPRNLTVSALDTELSPEFSGLPSSLSVTGDVEDELLLKTELHNETATTSAVEVDPAFHGLAFDDFPELESEDDFVNGLVNLGGELSTSSVTSPAEVASRSRASSSISSSSDFECDQFFDTWEASTTAEAEGQQSKRQRTASGSMPIFTAAGESCTSGSTEQAANASDEQNEASDNNTQSAGSASPDNGEGAGMPAVPVPTNRRGRKQSLTEDPSKIFACDLCNRRFRRQEHLKRHYRSLHTQEKPFSCHECGKKFSRSDNLAQHARTHGAGAFVMNLYDDSDMVATGSYPAHALFAQHAVGMGEDYSSMGRVLFQVASEIPGSASEISSDDASDSQGKKKRKRAE